MSVAKLLTLMNKVARCIIEQNIFIFITCKSYKLGLLMYFDFVGLETLGVKDFDKAPPGSDIDKIGGETFLKEA